MPAGQTTSRRLGERRAIARLGSGCHAIGCLALLLALGAAACGSRPDQRTSKAGTQAQPEGALVTFTFEQVVAVQERHVDALMALPGVVAVGIGALEDGRFSINISLARDDSEVRKRIPAQLEGVPVVVDVTGEVRPLRP